MEENLIGYLLDALDESDRREVEAHLSQHPEAQARLEVLRRALAPLAADAEPAEPPRHLALATLARIAETQCRSLPPAPPPPRRSAVPRRGWRRADVLVAAVLLLLVGGLCAPVAMYLWHSVRIQACKNNMAQFWLAMQLYGDHHRGDLPQVPERGPQSFAGMFVPMLYQNGCLNTQPKLACASSSPRSEALPSVQELEELRNQPDQTEFQSRARQLAGNYAYSLGYRENGVLKGPRTTDNSYLPILADQCLDPTGPDANSLNHGGSGQNVLYVGGHVRWHTTPKVGRDGDNIYLNRDNKVQAGVDHDDTVLGAGDATPSP